MTSPICISPSFSSQVPPLWLLGSQAHPAKVLPLRHIQPSKSPSEIERKPKFIPLLQGAGLLSQDSDFQACANCMATSDPSWLHIPKPGGASEGERRGRALGSGIRPPPPVLSGLGSARPRAEGELGSVIPVAECGDPQQLQERGESCMFNEKHLERKED